MIPFSENKLINLDKSLNYSFDLTSQKSCLFSRTLFDPGSYIKPRSWNLFVATMCDDISRIEKYLKIYNDGVNDLDKEKRNALQAALYSNNLTIKTCKALIQFGINLNQIDCDGNTALGRFVFYYLTSLNEAKLPLFRCIVEGGGDINVKYNFPLAKNINIREKIKSHPELEAIVQEVNAKRANYVYAALKGNFQVTILVCEMLNLSPSNGRGPLTDNS